MLRKLRETAEIKEIFSSQQVNGGQPRNVSLNLDNSKYTPVGDIFADKMRSRANIYILYFSLKL